MRLQGGLPVGDVAPLLIGEKLRLGAIERVGIDQAAAADTGTVGDEYVLERRQPEDALQAEEGRPEEAAELPARGGEILVGKAPPAFKNADLVSFLRQAQSRDAAAET